MELKWAEYTRNSLLSENELRSRWEQACWEGDIRTLQTLHSNENPYPIEEDACKLASITGQVSALIWLRGLHPPAPWNSVVCDVAANVQTLRWLRGQTPPCPWGRWTCAYAAKKGRLETLKWLRSRVPPCPWDEMTCAYAADSGRVDILKWLRSQNPPCPWDSSAAAYASNLKGSATLKWMRSQSPPCPGSERESFFNRVYYYIFPKVLSTILLQRSQS